MSAELFTLAETISRKEKEQSGYPKAGRREKLNARQKRNLQRAITRLRKNKPNFIVMDVVKESGINLKVVHILLENDLRESKVCKIHG